MSVFISSNERKRVKDAFGSHAVVCPIEGFDIALYTNRGLVAIERKGIAKDFIASITDGRLSKQIVAMREASAYPILMLGPGRFSFGDDGRLRIGKRSMRWTRTSIHNLLRTIQWVECVMIEPPIGFLRNYKDLVQTVLSIQTFFDKDRHLSMKGRPSIDKEWGVVATREERLRYFYMGLPFISTTRAKKLMNRYPNPEDLFVASIDDIRKIPKFGSTIANGIYGFLHGHEYTKA